MIPEIGKARIKPWYLLLLLVITSCVPTNGQYTNTAQPMAARNEGQLSLFLNLREKESPRTIMELERVEILTEKGNWEEINRDKITLDAGSIAGGQVFLLRSSLTPGYYSTLRFTIARAWQQNKNAGRKDLAVNGRAVEVHLPKKLYFHLTW